MSGHDAGTAAAMPPGDGAAGVFGAQSMPRFAAAFESIAMAVLFFGVLTPIGVVMRISGRDRLRLRPRGDATSYWLTVGARGRGR